MLSRTESSENPAQKMPEVDSHGKNLIGISGLAGVVTDQSKAVVPNAIVRVIDNTKGTNQSTSTDQSIGFSFLHLPPTRLLLRVRVFKKRAGL